jgi:hypothetical protein
MYSSEEPLLHTAIYSYHITGSSWFKYPVSVVECIQIRKLMNMLQCEFNNALFQSHGTIYRKLYILCHFSCFYTDRSGNCDVHASFLLLVIFFKYYRGTREVLAPFLLLTIFKDVG